VLLFYNGLFLDITENRNLIEVWKEFSICDCVETIISCCKEIKPSTLHACWRSLVPCMIKEKDIECIILSPITEIIGLAAKFNITPSLKYQEVKDLILNEEALDEEDLFELISWPSFNSVNDENENSVALKLDLQTVKIGLNLAKDLENFFCRNDHSIIRRSKF
jgi:hypothetical protein